MKQINTKRIHNRRLVSGALFDFLAYLTSLKDPIIVGSSEDVLPALDSLVEWAKKRGLDIEDDPDINGWERKI